LQDLLRALPEDASVTTETTASRMTVRRALALQSTDAAAGDYPRIVSHRKNSRRYAGAKGFSRVAQAAEFAMAQQTSATT
jgi:hypothetical protein